MYVANQLGEVGPAREADRIAPEFWLGTLQGHGPDLFSQIAAFAIDDRGRIYILDGFSQAVRVFESDGEPIRTFGRKGQGPGEFSAAMGILFGTDGSIIIPDSRNARYSIHQRNGTFVRSVPREVVGGTPYPWPGMVDRNGKIIDWFVSRESAPGALGPSRLLYHPILKDLRSTQTDTFPPIVLDLDLADGGRVPQPYSNSLVFSVGADETIWFGMSRTYRLFQRTLQGDTIRVFSLDVTPKRLTALEEDTMAATWIPGYPLTADDVPDTKPVLLQIAVGPDGSVAVFPCIEGYDDGAVVDLFSSEGVFQKRLILSESVDLNLKAPKIQDGSLFGAIKGTMDVPFLVRYDMASDRSASGIRQNRP